MKNEQKPIDPFAPGHKTLQSARWFIGVSAATVVRARPTGATGATLYALPARWRVTEGGQAEQPPPLLFYRPSIIVRRHVGNVVSEDRGDLSIRGYRFHADIDEAEIALDFKARIEGREEDEYDYLIQAGYYDGFPVPVYQVAEMNEADYEETEGVITYCRYVRLFDFTTEYRARGEGQLVFLPASQSCPATEPDAVALANPLETVNITDCHHWRPLHRCARWFYFIPDGAASICQFEARG